MKQIAIYCVNYQSYDSLESYLKSIDDACRNAEEPLALTVFVADNTVPATAPVSYSPRHFSLQVLPTGQNMGYFGAVGWLMKQHPPQHYDYAIVSNVDVLLTPNFFTALARCGHDGQVGWIAPQIYSHQEKRDRNPKITQRYSRRKLQVLRMLFSIPPLYNIYRRNAYKQKKRVAHQPGFIYAGHGSFIILTKSYFERCGLIDYPMFLFCEEIYLGEQCLRGGLRVVYDPRVQVNDSEHVSTGTFRNSRYCQLNRKALSHILNTYYC